MKGQKKNAQDNNPDSRNLSLSDQNKENIPEDYLHLIDQNILESFSPQQKTEVLFLIKKITSTPTPKLVDLRFTIDLLITRYFVVILLGKDRRNRKRKYIPNTISKIGNLATAIFILVSLNIFIIGIVLLGLYLVKSAVGINFFDGHISDVIKDILTKIILVFVPFNYFII